MMMGMLQPLGIEKGKPFTPNERQKQILIDAAQTGEVMGLYGPTQPYFDRSWVLSDIEMIK